MPDYDNGVTISASYIVPDPGFVIAYVRGNSGSRLIYINGITVLQTCANSSYYDAGACSFLVDTNDIVTASTYSSPVYITYYPLKGIGTSYYTEDSDQTEDDNNSGSSRQ